MNQSNSQAARVIVVGGGISGLAAAFHLVESAPDCRLLLVDRRDRLGGVLHTVHENGFQVEQSADNFITTVPWGVELCRRLGLEEQLTETNPESRQTFVVRKGRLCRLPEGFLMMAPARLWPMALTPILSPWGKLRAALEYFLPPRRDEEDESMAQFVRRRLGREVFERLVEPLVSAVYAADMEKLSVLATLPQFRQMEREHGSLIRAMRRRKHAGHASGGQSGARYSLFLTLREGLSRLVEALAARLPAGSVQLGTTAAALERNDSRWQVTLCRTDGSMRSELFDGVILATRAYEAADLLRPLCAPVAELLAGIEYEGTAVLSLGYRREQIRHRLLGAGFVVPAVERSPILAASFSSQKYTHRAPANTVLLRVFAGGSRAPELAELPDDELQRLVLPELERLLGIEGKPLCRWAAHWPRSMPQYHVGHRERMAQAEQLLAQLPAVELAGNFFAGVGIPQCIRRGQQAAERLLAQLPSTGQQFLGPDRQ